MTGDYFCFSHCDSLWWHRFQTLCADEKSGAVIRQRGVQETESFHSPSDWPSHTSASTQAFAGPGLEDDIVCDVHRADQAQPAHTVCQRSKCCVSPSPRRRCFDRGLFLFLEKCWNVATKETAGLLWHDKWSEEQQKNMIRLVVVNLLCMCETITDYCVW